MADSSMSYILPDEPDAIVLVTDDDALACLIALEAAELALPLKRVVTVEREIGQGCAVLLDLDSHGGMQAALHGLVDRFVGICRQAATLPTLLRARAVHLLERPFATSELRTLLGMLRTGVLPRTVQVAPVYGSLGALPIKMEAAATLRCGDAIIRLTPNEAALMRCLLEHRGNTVTRDQLSACIGATGQDDKSNGVEVYLCYLRRKLEKPTGRRLITTVRGVGYRLEWGEQ